MVFLQRLLNGDREDGGEDEGNHGIERSGGEFGDDGKQRRVGGQTLDEQAAVEIALGKVQHCVGQRSGQRGEKRFDIAEFLSARRMMRPATRP